LFAWTYSPLGEVTAMPAADCSNAILKTSSSTGRVPPVVDAVTDVGVATRFLGLPLVSALRPEP